MVKRANNGQNRLNDSDHDFEHARDVENELDHRSGEETDSSTDERSDRGRQRPVNIKEFDGDMEPEAFLEWIDSIESYFDWKEVPTERKVKLVGAKLRGPTSTWWKHYQNDQESVQNLRQHLKTVKEYTQEFHRLSLRSNLVETENQRVSRYVNGLRLSIQDQVCLQRPYKVSDAYQLALKVETQLARSSSRRVGNDRSSGPSSSRSNNAIRDGRTAAPMCPNQQTNTGDGKGLQNQQNTRGQMNIKCYRCFEPGHKSNECLKRTHARVNLAEDGEVEENFEGFDDGNQHLRVNDLGGVEEEGTDGDLVGETLVARCSMFAPPVNNKDDWLRKNIFRTRCTAGGKLYNLIIDSGSSENLVAQEMVDKLKLKTKGHPQPYRILVQQGE
ncbi:hypothetical protein Acr_01g0013830 [Actinidia rufa]|uniref:CCHC-type domain-containing protein n=1 Tax=Actinidia rufa TaxID=165716 RepID=A0A7J0E506_9ERIC|nr:hypothetical protein Acr_01g0013830 [Actinidia rufa]